MTTNTATVSIPCPHCLRDPLVEIPVQWEQRGLEWVGHCDFSLLRIAVVVHRKQHT